MHLNAAWLHKFNRRTEDKRSDGYLLGIGYSQPVASDNLVVADLVREPQIEEDHEANLFEAGMRWQLTPLTMASAGAGAGFLDQSPSEVPVPYRHPAHADAVSAVASLEGGGG